MAFKTHLTNKYIKHPKDNVEPPYVEYLFIEKKFWEDFVKSHNTSEFLAKSQKEKENRAINIYPHRLSHGGYDKLEEKMIKEIRKQSELEFGDPSISLYCSPCPPSHHEKWKRAYQKPNGEFTSEVTREVSEKIVRRYFLILIILVNSIWSRPMKFYMCCWMNSLNKPKFVSLFHKIVMTSW